MMMTYMPSKNKMKIVDFFISFVIHYICTTFSNTDKLNMKNMTSVCDRILNKLHFMAEQCWTTGICYHAFSVILTPFLWENILAYLLHTEWW